MFTGILSGFFFAIMALSLKEVKGDITPFEALFARSVFFFFTASLLARSVKFPVNDKNLWMRSLFGALSILIYFFNILNHGASAAAVLNSLIPVFVICSGFFILKETTNLLQLTGVGLILISELVLKTSGTLPTSNSVWFLALIGCASGGLAYTFLKASSAHSPFNILKNSSFVFAIVSLPFVKLSDLNFLLKDFMFWVYIGSGLMGHYLLIHCFKRQTASLANLWTKPIIIWVALFEVILNIKHHTLFDFCMYFLIFFGVLLSGLKKSKDAKKTKIQKGKELSFKKIS